MYKHTCTDYNVLNVPSTCAIWNTVTFTFYHFTICDLVTFKKKKKKIETKCSMQGFILNPQ